MIIRPHITLLLWRVYIDWTEDWQGEGKLFSATIRTLTKNFLLSDSRDTMIPT